MTVMMTMMSDGYDEDPIFMFFIYDSKVPLDPIGNAEGGKVIIIMMTVGDAEDAR